MFEFNEADQRVAFDTVDYWIDSAAQGRQNLAPEKIPWVALRTLLGQFVYGGRVDNSFDLRLLDSFLEQLFTEQSFNADFPLFRASRPDQPVLTIPENAAKKSHFLKWIDALPSTESPTWLGLPENAEVLLLTKKGQSVLRKLLKLQTIEEDLGDDTPAVDGKPLQDKRPAWMVSLQTSIEQWLANLPQKVDLMERTAESVKKPLFRFFERECEIGAKLLKKVREDLNDLAAVCEGTLKQTNYIRELISNLSKGVIPTQWRKYPVPSSTSLNVWIVDFARRLKQLQEVRKSRDFLRTGIWVGGLFIPEAYITATRQAAAQANQWSVENLVLQVEILKEGQDPDIDETSFVVIDITLEGASWNGKSLQHTNEIAQQLPPVKFQWHHKAKDSDTRKTEEKVALPVYLNETRAEFLVAVDLPSLPNVPLISWYQKGVGMSVWKSDL
jgi:dynein heavy chain 1